MQRWRYWQKGEETTALFSLPHKPNEAGHGGSYTERAVVKIVLQTGLNHNINHK